MGFLRRLLGGDDGSRTSHAPVDAAEAEAAERQYELDLLREEQERMDELTRRQLRYESYSWAPPAEGGDRRAEDADKAEGESG
jgi:hypothetical protein